jgi:hypothetical protein
VEKRHHVAGLPDASFRGNSQKLAKRAQSKKATVKKKNCPFVKYISISPIAIGQSDD